MSRSIDRATLDELHDLARTAADIESKVIETALRLGVLSDVTSPELGAASADPRIVETDPDMELAGSLLADAFGSMNRAAARWCAFTEHAGGKLSPILIDNVWSNDDA